MTDALTEQLIEQLITVLRNLVGGQARQIELMQKMIDHKDAVILGQDAQIDSLKAMRESDEKIQMLQAKLIKNYKEKIEVLENFEQLSGYSFADRIFRAYFGGG